MTFANDQYSAWPEAHGDPEVDFCRRLEIRRLWRESCEGLGMAQWIPTPLGFTVAVPSIGTITLGAPTVMTVQLRSTQRIEQLEAVASDIAAAMGVGELRATPFRGSWVLVELHAASRPVSTAVSPRPERRGTVAPLRRRGPSTAWTGRWHVRRSRPEQSS